MRKFYTAEAVTEGHPDKVCDQIADAILDVCLKNDENSKVVCEGGWILSCPHQHRHLKRKNSILFLVFFDLSHFNIEKFTLMWYYF